MIFSKRSLEGYLLIDHTNSPGLSDGEMPLALTADGTMAELPIGELRAGHKLESATLTCSHCARTFIKNNQRTRPRGHCHFCQQYLCDPCDAIYAKEHQCRSVAALADRIAEAVDKGVL
jgi:hypothetical protein